MKREFDRQGHALSAALHAGPASRRSPEYAFANVAAL